MAKRNEKIAREAREEGESYEEEKREHRARGGATHESHGGHREVSGGNELETEGEMPGHMHDKKGGEMNAHGKAPHHMLGHAHHAKRRRGGKSEDGEPEGGGKVQVYNAKGSKEVEDAEDEKDEFKKGGHKGRKHGGHAEGGMEAKRLDRRPRRAAGGGVKGAEHSPFSSASKFESPADVKASRGFEGTEKKT